MKSMTTCLGILITLCALSSTLRAQAREAWGADELASAATAATAALAQEYGEQAAANTTEISLKLRSTKTAARATFVYTEGGESKTVSFFCHTHGDEIDCH